MIPHPPLFLKRATLPSDTNWYQIDSKEGRKVPARSRLGVPVLALSRTLKSTYQGGVLVYSQKYTCAVWWCKKCPLSIIFVVSAGSEASDSSRRRSITSATVAPDRPNVCRAASDGENTPIAAPTRRHLSPTSAQTTKQGWVHEKRSSTEKPFLLGQRPERSRCLGLIQLRLGQEGPGETKALPAGESRLEVPEWSPAPRG